MELSNTFVILMGLAIVFIGLICIIVLCEVVGAICKKFVPDVKDAERIGRGTQGTVPVMQNAAAPLDTGGESEIEPSPAIMENRQEFIAAVSTVIAEELGKDVSAIRILSVRQI